MTGTIAAGLALILAGTGAWMTWMPGSSAEEPLPELTQREMELAGQLESDVRALSEDIGERNMFTPGSMEESVEWIRTRMIEAGYEPRLHRYELGEAAMPQLAGETADNLIAEVTGTERPDEIIAIGAHYDSVSASPGANDNASAVAALLALAEWFRERPQPRTLRFVSFANEEHPFFMTPDMGSYAWAERAGENGENIRAMMSMDGIGYYSDEEDSQQYPYAGIGLLYPNEGNFIGFVTRVGDARLLRRAIGAFRETGRLPSEGAALPQEVPGIGWSDHWAFWQHDIPAFLVTDTLPFRDPHYHSPGDTADRLDYERMARLVKGLKAVVEALAE